MFPRPRIVLDDFSAVRPVPATACVRTPGMCAARATVVHPPTNERFVADGYGHHRVAVFDAETGAFKWMWGCRSGA